MHIERFKVMIRTHAFIYGMKLISHYLCGMYKCVCLFFLTKPLYSYFRVWTTSALNDTSTETWPLETSWWRARWGWKSVTLAWPRCCRRTKSTTLWESPGKAPSFGEEHTLHVFISCSRSIFTFCGLSISIATCFDWPLNATVKSHVIHTGRQTCLSDHYLCV